MNQRKPNSSLWYSLGLGLLLCMAVVVVSTGTAFARYRAERTKELTFSVQDMERIYLGEFHTVTAEEATEERPQNTTYFREQNTFPLKNQDGILGLDMVVTNGKTESEYSERSQQVQIRILATSGVWTGMEPAPMELTISSQGNPDTEETVKAVAVQIEEGTALFRTFGAGWVYMLKGEDGELSWTLPGGEFSYLNVSVVMSGANPQQNARLEPRITASTIH